MKLLFGCGVNDVPLDLKSSTPRVYEALMNYTVEITD